MKLNANLRQPALMRSAELAWVASPMAGVERKLLERDGDEVARATSLVRYAAGSRFAAHDHGAGEEFLVLEGVFGDEHGAYPAGTYVRNPPGSRHSPFSAAGCTLLVKLRQIAAGDDRRVVVDTSEAAWRPDGAGVARLALHAHGDERVSLVRLRADAALPTERYPLGVELFIVAGTVVYAANSCPPGTWLRLPAGSSCALECERDATVYLKSGHLPAEPA